MAETRILNLYNRDDATFGIAFQTGDIDWKSGSFEGTCFLVISKNELKDSIGWQSSKGLTDELGIMPASDDDKAAFVEACVECVTDDITSIEDYAERIRT
jgi:hypothetical protein